MKKNKAQVFHYDLYGKREGKYEFLNKNNIHSIEWKELEVQEPNFFFVYKDTAGQEEYEKGFKLDNLIIEKANGIKTQRDDASIKFNIEEADAIKDDFLTLSNKELKTKYGFKDVRDWKIDFAKSDLKTNPILARKLDYRPFDIRYMNYTGKTKGVMGYPRYNLMRHFLNEKTNLALILVSQPQAANLNYFDCLFITNKISDTNYFRRGGPSVFPLYLYPDSTELQLDSKAERVPNLNMEIVEQIEKKSGYYFSPERPDYSKQTEETFQFYPDDILDYIYAVLHSPTYREKYKEFLKIDFPRIPYPNMATFMKLVELGHQLREIHLLESPIVENYVTTYPKSGSNEITRKLTKNSPGFVPTENGLGQVWINDEQYFDKVSEIAWNFFIGGYQPAQKWLKDRVGRILDFEDILHYQKIIVALTETDRLMKEIDKI